MRELIEQKVSNLWAQGYDEGITEACFCQKISEKDWLIAGCLRLESKVVNDNFANFLNVLDDENLIVLYERQLCQKFR